MRKAFCTLKEKLVTAPVAAYPDFSKPFRLYTDASNTGLGAILAQVQEGKERIICCASRSLNKSERNYSTTKKECLAIIWGGSRISVAIYCPDISKFLLTIIPFNG